MTQRVFPILGGRLERMHKRLDMSLPGAYILFGIPKKAIAGFCRKKVF